MTVDYHALNSKTIPDRFPLPQISNILESSGQSTVFMKLYLDSGYNQVSWDPRDALKTAFLNEQGLYEYTVLLLGLSNAPETVQWLMIQILWPQLDKRVAVYLDDICKGHYAHASLTTNCTSALAHLHDTVQQARLYNSQPTSQLSDIYSDIGIDPHTGFGSSTIESHRYFSS